MHLSFFRLETPTLALQTSPEGGLKLLDNQTGRSLILTPSIDLFCPVIDGERCALVFSRLEQKSPGEVDIHFTSPRLESFVLRIEALAGEDAMDISCVFRVREAGQINRLDFVPEGSALAFYNLVNYRNHHFTTTTWPELLIEAKDSCKTDTYSADWQFAPHPSLFVFRKHELQFLFGAFDMPRAFGMHIDVGESKVRHWYLDLGDEPDGQRIAAGDEFISARFRLFARRSKTLEEMLDIYGRMLMAAGQIPDPAKKVRYTWWREPLYCTFIDQVLLSRTKVPVDLKEQSTFQSKVHDYVNESVVRAAVEVIEREKLPFRTILLDSGWQTAAGQWEPHPRRLPHFRALVDDLHAKGFKVVVWWNWAQIEEDAVVNPEELAGGGKLNRHGCRVRDYSLPVTQDYLRKLFYRLFSSDPGCYDLDGVKTDFLADKVHADIPVSDPAWRGEENYFLQVTRLFYNELKRHKPDGIHIGCAGHFWLAEYIDINRTYDCCGSNCLQHASRGRMLEHTTPGCPVSYDFHNFIENLSLQLAVAHENAASVQIGNILLVQDNPLSEVTQPSPDYFALLRANLPFQSLRNP